MIAYLARRVLAAVPTLVGVNALTFALFFVVNPPERMARRILGERRVTPAQVRTWLQSHDYDHGMFFDARERGIKTLTETVFFKKSAALLWFDFGVSDRNNIPSGEEIRRRMPPSLAVTVPMFLLELAAYLTAALVIAYARGTYLDAAALVACVLLMSVSYLFYIVGGQWVLAKSLHLFPISGYDHGLHALPFVLLPVLIGLAAGAGASIRFYRAVFLEELGKDHIRTARAKGLSTGAVLFRHA
ncbi:MAG: ABC transporter permease, partial [bacterium]